jgi:hypothetical protein
VEQLSEAGVNDYEPPDVEELDRLRREALKTAIARTKAYLAELRAGGGEKGNP